MNNFTAPSTVGNIARKATQADAVPWNSDIGANREAAMTGGARVRTFINVREPNTVFQIVDGGDTPDSLNPPIVTFEGGVQHPRIRRGDKFIEFRDGYCVTTDPEVIAHCERMRDVFDVEDPSTPALVVMAKLSVPLDNYEPESSVDLVETTRAAIDAAVARAVEARMASMDSQQQTSETEKKYGE